MDQVTLIESVEGAGNHCSPAYTQRHDLAQVVFRGKRCGQETLVADQRKGGFENVEMGIEYHRTNTLTNYG